MATAPVRELVVLSIATALRGISQANGYHYDVRPESVYTEPVNLLAVPATQVPACIVAEDVRGARAFHHSTRVREVIALLVTVRVDATDALGGADAKFVAAARIAADVERAVMVDLTRGGVAFLTLVQTPEPAFMGVGPVSPVLINIPVDVTVLRILGAS